jgi:hypothetical protein
MCSAATGSAAAAQAQGCGNLAHGPAAGRDRGDSGRGADRSVVFAFEIAFGARKSDSAIVSGVALSVEKQPIRACSVAARLP